MVTDIGTGDPNAVIIDPTEGTGINIQGVFNQFGYYPTQSEIAALAPAFSGIGVSKAERSDIFMSAVGQYVLQKQAEAERQKNDPLGALQTKINDSVTLMKNQVQGLQGQLQDVLTSAPELFGNLTPDQINEYLAPLKTQFDYQLGEVQGALGQRGLGGSSTEANALAEAGTQFKENVLQTGLNIGLTSQKNRADALQTQINNLFGLTGTEEQIGVEAAARKSAQDLGQSNLIASLPYFLNQSSQQQRLIDQQLNNTGGFFDTFNKVTGAINTGVGSVNNLLSIGKNFIPSPGGGGGTPQYASAIGPNLPGNPYAQFALPAGGAQTPAMFQG